MFIRSRRVWFRRLTSIGVIGLTGITIRNIRNRYSDRIEDNCEFSNYTNCQHRKYLISGMHEPFITKDIEQLKIFRSHFSEYEFLIGTSLDEVKFKHSLKSPVKFKSYEQFLNRQIDLKSSTLIVGGPPALISAVGLVSKHANLIYLNDFRTVPIANGSAWHLEQDAQTEAPTNYKPHQFLLDQLKRVLLNNVSFKNISSNGEFPWRTIDWIGWIKHPDHWFRSFLILFKFEFFTIFNDRDNLLNDLSKQCFKNEEFYEKLNENLNSKILLEEKGSIIIARNQEEIKGLNQLRDGLIKEGRQLNILSKEDLFHRYSFIPNGILFAEKAHDRVLKANFMKILNEYLIKQGATVLNGTLESIYYNSNSNEGIAEFRNDAGQLKSIQFSRLILSLGNQEILNKNNKRLFDVVSARGVSVLAHVYLPKGTKLPPVLVCGGTNHATKLTNQPISFNNHYDLYLMRFTAGACITPNVCNSNTSFYDGTIAVGLIQSIKKTFPSKCEIHPIFVYGCNRQVSQYGQIKWIEPFKNIFIQYGAAGGGLTRAPHFITSEIK